MIGFYDYTVVLTYIGLASAVIGMTQVFGGSYWSALLCLIISGTCDMFDGKIARTKKNRTKHEKVFGIQIDSLCDLICFGMLPATIGFSMTYYEELLRFRILGTFAAVVFVLAAVIRLAYFNVMEEERQEQTDENRKYYQGLPVTSVSIILPLVYMICTYFDALPLAPSYSVAMIIISLLFVLDVKVRKPGNVGAFIMVIIGLLVLAGVLTICR